MKKWLLGLFGRRDLESEVAELRMNIDVLHARITGLQATTQSLCQVIAAHDQRIQDMQTPTPGGMFGSLPEIEA